MKRLLMGAAAAVLAVSASADWSDNFDSYKTGINLHGVGGWAGWDNNPNAGAFTSDAHAMSAPNSVDINGASDLTHEYDGYTSGVVTYSAMMYIPGKFTGDTYFILLNTYDPGGSQDWSLQMHFSSTDGMIHNNGGSGNMVTQTLVPYVTDEWASIVITIDLDNNTHTGTYNGQEVVSGPWYGGANGQAYIGAVDLFANNAQSVFYDDMSLSTVPEPATIAALAVGILALVARRRK